MEDVVKATCISSTTQKQSGIFNLGTGQAQSFNDVAVATVNTLRNAEGKTASDLIELHRQGLITYIPFRDQLKEKYQSFTQADVSAHGSSAYKQPFLNVEQGVGRYVAQMRKNAS